MEKADCLEIPIKGCDQDQTPLNMAYGDYFEKSPYPGKDEKRSPRFEEHKTFLRFQ